MHDEAGISPLTPGGSEPLYHEVRRRIEQILRTQNRSEQRALPSSRYLASALGVSRNTVNVAYDELIALGLVESRPRSGLYPTKIARELSARAIPPEGGASRIDWAARVEHSPPAIEAPRVHPDWLSAPFPFLPGQPEPRAFPARAWTRATSDALYGEHLAYSIRDSSDRDDPLLVEMIRQEILVPRGVAAEPESILVTQGAQEALSLIADVAFHPHTTVALEDPGYRDAAHIVSEAGARILPIPVDREGARVPGDARFDYLLLTPSHHHPTSVTLSYPRRLDLLQRARAEDFVIIEDDYDSEVRYRGRPTPSLKSLDTDGRVVYIGTFSKFLAPGIRLGFVVAAPELISLLRRRRRYSNRHPSGHGQRALGLFIQRGDYHRALRRHRTQLRGKWEVLCEALDAELPWPLNTPAAGGMSVWVTGDEDFDGSVTAVAAARRGVLIDPGAAFHLSADPPRNSIRIGFNAIPAEAIRPGIRVLGEVIRSGG